MGGIICERVVIDKTMVNKVFDGVGDAQPVVFAVVPKGWEQFLLSVRAYKVLGLPHSCQYF